MFSSSRDIPQLLEFAKTVVKVSECGKITNLHARSGDSAIQICVVLHVLAEDSGLGQIGDVI